MTVCMRLTWRSMVGLKYSRRTEGKGRKWIERTSAPMFIAVVSSGKKVRRPW